MLLKDVLELAKLDERVNTIAVKGADGYTAKLPLRYALDKDAMFVYQVGGKDVPSGNQFWVPETVAKYFTRNVMEIADCRSRGSCGRCARGRLPRRGRRHEHGSGTRVCRERNHHL